MQSAALLTSVVKSEIQQTDGKPRMRSMVDSRHRLMITYESKTQSHKEYIVIFFESMPVQLLHQPTNYSIHSSANWTIGFQ